ncbi:MAG: hypothetical protein ACLQCU_09160 [Acidimicrobiales bacterium]
MSGTLIGVDLEDDLLMFVQNGHLSYTLNTSTGGGYTYTDAGVRAVANAPGGGPGSFTSITRSSA